MTPAGIVAVAGSVVSVFAVIRRPSRSQRNWSQFALAMASWGGLWFAGSSAFAKDGMSNLAVHMVGHIILMFMVPMGLVFSGAARSTWWLLNRSTRRRLLRWWYVDRRWRVPRWLAHPFTAALVMNGVMVASHTPVVFDAVMEHTWAMDWIMEPAFVLSGLFFFHFILSSPPRKNHVRLRYQLVMVLFTMVEMVVLAMSMAIFSHTSWYSVMQPVAGATTMTGMHASSMAQAFQQQQLAAAILWICGDFWAVPCVIEIVRRVVAREGSVFGALDRTSEQFLTKAS